MMHETPRDGEPASRYAIVAVNFNGEALVDRFMAAVQASNLAPETTVVVDNSSVDDSADRFAAAGATVIRSAVNLGFGRGCNVGAQHCGSELILFMNPDVRLHSDTASTLVSAIDDPDVAIACACTHAPGESEPQRTDELEPVAAMVGACMMVRRSDFDALGGFDDSIFLYSEDTDLCFRAWLQGRVVLKVWAAIVEHDRGGTGGGSRWTAEQIRNGLYVHMRTRAWPAVAYYAGLAAVKTVMRTGTVRDPAIPFAWVRVARELPRILADRRRLRGASTPARRARLEELGRAHAYWDRRDAVSAISDELRARVAALRSRA